MFDFFSHLTALAVVVPDVAIFSFRPDLDSYDFRGNDLVIQIFHLEPKRIDS